MGRIRTLPVKNLAKELIDTYPDKFTDDFDKNKKVLEEIIKITSKKIRNQLAGYITNVIKSKATPKVFETPYQVIESKKRRERGRQRR